MSSSNEGLKASQERLWKLVEERCRPGANVAELDQRIWDLFGEDWAIMFTDLSGFSRRVSEFGIIHFLQVIHEQRKLLLPIVESFDGLLLKEEGDSFMIMFRTAGRAVECGIAMQHACRNVNERRKPEEEILLCLGIGYGRILRIEILLTDAARQAIGEKPDYGYEDIGPGSFDGPSNWRLQYK